MRRSSARSAGRSISIVRRAEAIACSRCAARRFRGELLARIHALCMEGCLARFRPREKRRRRPQPHVNQAYLRFGKHAGRRAGLRRDLSGARKCVSAASDSRHSGRLAPSARPRSRPRRRVPRLCRSASRSDRDLDRDRGDRGNAFRTHCRTGRQSGRAARAGGAAGRHDRRWPTRPAHRFARLAGRRAL